ncbi:FMN reductase (NADH) RutF [Hartmannibacter diazotrophicus]|uniref:FMN reductase (NADH) RutF n=1 Tax=Hartmannibacter diazotrophicus TaxID=1482074 RepID=A0A2C9D800_9HYPH|nr:flavin reductase family protein [Hartmannibacter diazotrophicus]SON55665.1 FMN reductase (NADH) RutF [Hartmannibacter diazotrophicus]
MALADHASDTMTALATASEDDVFAIPTVEKQVYRDGMARLAAAVNIITSTGEGGWVGFTASAVTSVTDSPATLLVCVNKGVQAHATLSANRILCVNTVAGPHEDLAMAFAGGSKDMATRFAGAEWTTMVTGAPVLEGAAVAFDCRVSNIMSGASHDVFFCEVLAVRHSPEADALVYHARKFHRLS